MRNHATHNIAAAAAGAYAEASGVDGVRRSGGALADGLRGDPIVSGGLLPLCVSRNDNALASASI